VPSTDNDRWVIVYWWMAGRAVSFMPNSTIRPPTGGLGDLDGANDRS
jgi:hypothetical protein